MQINIIPCNYAIAQDGAFNLMGAGRIVWPPQPAPSGLAIEVLLTWSEANHPYDVIVELVDEDGHELLNDEGTPLFRVEGRLEVGRPAGMPVGLDLDSKVAFGVPPLPLQPGRTYTWRASILGDGGTMATRSFYVQPLQIPFQRAS